MKIVTVLDLENTTHAQALVNSDYFVAESNESGNFTDAASVEQLAATTTAATGLRTALNAPVGVSKNADIVLARGVLDWNLTKQAGIVEDKSNNPALTDAVRMELAISSGMNIKGYTRPPQHTFSAKNTNISGQIDLSAKGRINGHQWEYTYDVVNFTGRIPLDSTTVAKQTINNATKGKEIAIFHKPIIAKTQTAWEGPIFITVT